MSQETASGSTKNYQSIFDSALESYKKKTKNDLVSHPLLAKLEACHSPEAVLTTLREQIPGFDQSRSSDHNLTRCLNSTVKVISSFSGIIGGGVSLAYPPTGVIFTGIGVLLSTATAVATSRDTLIDLFERIENFFIRLEVYIDVPPTAGMTDMIVKVMTELLSVLGIAMKEIKQGKAKTFLKKLVGRTDIEDALGRLDKLTQEEARMAAAESLKATHGVDDKVVRVENEVQVVSDQVLGVSSQVHGIGDQVQGVDHKINVVIDGGDKIREEIQAIASDVGNQMRQNLENWLSPPDPSINYNTASDAHHEGTAVWFTQSRSFDNWKQSNSLIWIHGKPGSGKTVLSSAIVYGISDICSAGSGHIAFFFFDFKDTAKQDARALLSSLIVQLSNQSNSFYDILLRFYSAHQGGTQQPSIGALTKCLVDMLKVPGDVPIYIIIDALDECPNTTGMPSSRDQVLVWWRTGQIGSSKTSLEPLTLESNRISLHDEIGQKQDIVDFISAAVYSDKNMRRWRDEDKRLVIETLSDRADGMFRWVYCQLEVLRHCLPPSVRSILAELPETLDETYERILQEIPKSNRVSAHRLLQCLTVAIRPLRVKELAEVLAITFTEAGGVPSVNEHLRWEDQEQAVLSACSSLVAIVQDRGRNYPVVQFSHFSVKEFLTSDRLAASKVDACRYHHIRPDPAHTIMVQACLGALLQLDDHVNAETLWTFPLAHYAAHYFDHHVAFGNVLSLSHVQDAIGILLDTNKPHFIAWLRASGNLDWDESPPGVPFYCMAKFGFRSMMWTSGTSMVELRCI
ncbi:hypothetical protein BJV74DRAFT_911015 [Russula compacta]|nr:hypothetical protein BJV74DRAFT_911015 [Russula compacta]